MIEKAEIIYQGIIGFAPIEENCTCAACKAKRLCGELIEEVKRLREGIEKHEQRNDGISGYSYIDRELYKLIDKDEELFPYEINS